MRLGGHQETDPGNGCPVEQVKEKLVTRLGDLVAVYLLECKGVGQRAEQVCRAGPAKGLPEDDEQQNGGQVGMHSIEEDRFRILMDQN